jgi:hypothetical protein
MNDEVAGSPLAIALSAAVPLRIFELEARGGPTPGDLERARDFSDVLAEKGDILLFGSPRRKAGKKKKAAGGGTERDRMGTADVFNGLASALAVMAYCPGGVKAFGSHWRAGPLNAQAPTTTPAGNTP